MSTTPHNPPAAFGLPTRRPPGIAPGRLAGVLVRAWLEVVSGRRPLAQLEPVLAPVVRRRLAHRLHHRPDRWRATGPVLVRRVVASEPTAGVCEATVLVEQQQRTTAFAVRLELHRGRWRVVELAAPEDGDAPLRTASLPVGHRPRDAFDEVLGEPVAHAP